MRGILQDHWPVSSTMSQLKRTKRLRDIESWSVMLPPPFFTLTKSWENCEFMSFLNHWKTDPISIERQAPSGTDGKQALTYLG